MPTPTYTALANLTLTTADASITFSSIPSTYRDLVLVIGNAKSNSGNPAVVYRFNGVDTATYQYVRMTGDGTTPQGTATTTTLGYLAARFGIDTTNTASMIANIMDYSTTNKHKIVLVRGGAAGLGVEAIAGRWQNTNAITSMEVFCSDSLSFASGTTFALYGIVS